MNVTALGSSRGIAKNDSKPISGQPSSGRQSSRIPSGPQSQRVLARSARAHHAQPLYSAAAHSYLVLRGDNFLSFAVRMDSGEVYDFEFQPETAGEIPVEVSNVFGDAKLNGKIVVQ